jgi:hypothetical protein
MDAELSADIDAVGLVCPLCGKPLADDWGGYPACFCTFNGRSPSADEVIWLAEIAEEIGSRH